MLIELLTWNKYKCFSCKFRQEAITNIDVRWVLKSKWEYLVVDAVEGQKEDFT